MTPYFVWRPSRPKDPKWLQRDIYADEDAYYSAHSGETFPLLRTLGLLLVLIYSRLSIKLISGFKAEKADLSPCNQLARKPD
jgi:hypothetical protein